MLKESRRRETFLVDGNALEYINKLKEEIEEKDKIIQRQQDLIDKLWERMKK